MVSDFILIDMSYQIFITIGQIPVRSWAWPSSAPTCFFPFLSFWENKLANCQLITLRESLHVLSSRNMGKYSILALYCLNIWTLRKCLFGQRLSHKLQSRPLKMMCFVSMCLGRFLLHFKIYLQLYNTANKFR